MKHNLLNTFDEEIKPVLFDELKRESPTIDKVIYQHLTIIHASILGGLIEKSKKPKGSKAIKNLIEKGNHDGRIIHKIPEIFGDEQELSNIKKLGNSLLAFVFDDGTDKAFEKIQHFLSEKYLTKEEDLIDVNRMIAPFSMGLIGRIIHDEKMTDHEVGQLLKANEPHISVRFPGLAKVLGLENSAPESTSSTGTTGSSEPSQKEGVEGTPVPPKSESGTDESSIVLDEDRKLFLKSLWPWVLMLVVAGASLFILKKFESKTSDELERKPDNPFNFIQSDSLGLGNNNAFTLPGNVRLKVDKNSSVDSLLTELEDNKAQIDTLRYWSSRISFQDSTAILTSTANKELSDLLTVLQSYPDLYMDIHLHYNDSYLARNPNLANEQIKSLNDYFTVFGLDQSRLKIIKSTIENQESQAGEMPTDTVTEKTIPLDANMVVKNKKVELLFYHKHTNKVDSLKIQ